MPLNISTVSHKEQAKTVLKSFSLSDEQVFDLTMLYVHRHRMVYSQRGELMGGMELRANSKL